MTRNNLARCDARMSSDFAAGNVRDFRHCRMDGQCRLDRATHVVAMSKRGAESRHGPVTDVLIDTPAEFGDDAINLLEEHRQQCVDILSVKLTAQSREPSDIDD